MLVFATAIILAAANPAESNLKTSNENSSEILMLDETLDAGFDIDDLVLDDSLLTDTDSELLELE